MSLIHFQNSAKGATLRGEWNRVKDHSSLIFSHFLILSLINSLFELKIHIRRFQEYFIHIHILIGSITLQFLQFWYQNGVNILFLLVKPIEVTSGFILKLMKKFARWRCCWNIWHLSLKTKISPLIVRYQESNEYQKNRQDLINSDLEVCYANIQPKLKNLRSSTKNQLFFMVSGGFLKFIQYWLNISA